jgi:hypothetical protein
MLIPQAALDAMTNRELSVVQYVIIHHTAEPNMNEDITKIACAEIACQGFLSVGYHAVLQGSGLIQYGRPIGKVPAAAEGLNTESYDFALEGNFHPGSTGYCGEKPTSAQIRSAINLIYHVKSKFPNVKYLIGHRDVARICGIPGNATACPGDDLYSRLDYLRAKTGLIAA